jgi:hypothetical protein
MNAEQIRDIVREAVREELQAFFGSRGQYESEGEKVARFRIMVAEDIAAARARAAVRTASGKGGRREKRQADHR